MFLKNIKEQIYALAGLHQACLVVSNLAWRGEYENKDFDALINCIIDTKSTTIENIFISQNYIEKGLKHLKKQIIDDIFTRSSETRRYISSLEALVNKVGKSEEMISDIGKSIDKLDSSFNTFTYDDKTKIISDGGIKFSGDISTPCDLIIFISSIKCQGSRTTPFPMTDSLPPLTTPDGRACNL